MTTSEESESNSLSESSLSVQTHLGIIQGVIQRMATNSSSCKAWCITIVSAVLVIASDGTNPNMVFIAVIPNFLFGALDAYYLALEMGFRESYNGFVKKLYSDQLYSMDLYSVEATGDSTELQLNAIRSFSIWGFYLTLAAMILISKVIIM